ncbi:DUF6442 family protein [Faecalispora anaeroviscerum]|uniref:DUF6442 family protein n=1 Tax=Faecalispora anaeroviscerum TaxID=2991836 RepID=UPI0024B91170|nr:DUF6442 family protein [Faecalispora anaeroviscerum]
MDRNLILNTNKKARIRDEGTEFVDNRARQKGEFVLMCFMALLMGYNLFKGIHSYDLMTVFWAYTAVTNLYKYKEYHQKADLVAAIGGIVAALGFLLSYLLETW